MVVPRSGIEPVVDIDCTLSGVTICVCLVADEGNVAADTPVSVDNAKTVGEALGGVPDGDDDGEKVGREVTLNGLGDGAVLCALWSSGCSTFMGISTTAKFRDFIRSRLFDRADMEVRGES